MGQATITSAAAMSGLENLLADLGAAADETPVVELEAVGDASALDVLATVDAESPAPEAPAAAPEKGKGKKGGKGKGAGKKGTTASTKEVPVTDLIPQNVVDAAGGELVQPAGDTAPAETKGEDAPTPPQRVFFGRNKLGRLEHKLGADLGKMLVLTLGDAELEGDKLAAKVAETRDAFKKMGVKVQNRATNLIEFISGKTLRLNPVIETALRMLSKDGKLVSGDEGNLHKRLIAKPYTPAAARAMGNNTLNMLRQLKLVSDGGKQTLVPSADSTLLALVSDRMGLAFVDNEEAIAAAEEREAQEIAARKAAAPVEPTNVPDAPVDNTEQLATVDAPVLEAAPEDNPVGDLLADLEVVSSDAQLAQVEQELAAAEF